MSLGNSFPPRFRLEQLRRQLKSGAVIKLFKQTSDGVVREKRYVVVHVDDQTITCIINSNIGPFLLARPNLLRCQVKMDAQVHTFMNHDSHVDCSTTHTFATGEVITELMAKPDWILGEISQELRAEMVAAVKIAPTLSPAQVAVICASLAEDT